MKTSLMFFVVLFISLTLINTLKALSFTTANGKHSVAVPSSVTPSSAATAGLHLKFELDSVVYDEIGIYYSAAWSDKYDSNDAYDLDGFDPKVYLSSFTSDGVRVSVNAWSNYTTPARIKLYVRAVASGNYTLSIEDFSNIDTSLYAINLVDNLKSDSVNLAKIPIYKFNIDAADTAAYDNRFVLAIEQKPKNLPPYQLANFDGEKTVTGVQINWKAYNAADTKFILQRLNSVDGYDSLYSVQSDSAVNYSYVDQHPVIGNNVYRLKQNGFSGQITYSIPVTVGYGTITIASALSVYPNPSKSSINVSIASGSTNNQLYTEKIYNLSGSLVVNKSIDNSTFTQDISSYNTGMYFIQLTDVNGNLVGQSKFIKSN